MKRTIGTKMSSDTKLISRNITLRAKFHYIKLGFWKERRKIIKLETKEILIQEWETNRNRDIIWKVCKETTFQNWHNVTDVRDDETLDDQNDDEY